MGASKSSLDSKECISMASDSDTVVASSQSSTKYTTPFGVGVFEVPKELLTPIQEVFSHLEAVAPTHELPDWITEVFPCMESPREINVPPYTFYVTEAATTGHMKWFWPRDKTTMSLFEPLFHAALRAGLQAGPAAKGSLQLWSATIIMRKANSLKDEDADFHKDYGKPGVPPGFAFSLLTPLMDMPEGAGGLEFYPWRRQYCPNSVYDAEGEFANPPESIGYRVGQLVAVDGQCIHRTQPYTLGRNAKSSTRVIISLDVHSTAPDAAAAACRKSVHQQHVGYAYVTPNPWDEQLDHEGESTCSGSESE